MTNEVKIGGGPSIEEQVQMVVDGIEGLAKYGVPSGEYLDIKFYLSEMLKINQELKNKLKHIQEAIGLGENISWTTFGPINWHPTAEYEKGFNDGLNATKIQQTYALQTKIKLLENIKVVAEKYIKLHKENQSFHQSEEDKYDLFLEKKGEYFDELEQALIEMEGK